jgi:alkyl hydroperoxide reductase subunit AhpC
MPEAKTLVGRRAPGFELECTTGPGGERRRISLDDFQDRWLMLLFYPRDFSLV